MECEVHQVQHSGTDVTSVSEWNVMCIRYNTKGTDVTSVSEWNVMCIRYNTKGTVVTYVSMHTMIRDRTYKRPTYESKYFSTKNCGRQMDISMVVGNNHVNKGICTLSSVSTLNNINDLSSQRPYYDPSIISFTHFYHLYGFSPVCILICTFKLPASLNNLPHSTQQYGL